jgi:hypothetical protein
MDRAPLNGLTGAATTGVRDVWPGAGPGARERKGTSRRRLLDLSVAVIEDAQSPPTPDGSGPKGFSADFQVALPYQGLLVWHVGRDAVVGDANQVLFVAGGEPYRISDSLATRMCPALLRLRIRIVGADGHLGRGATWHHVRSMLAAVLAVELTAWIPGPRVRCPLRLLTSGSRRSP